MDKKYSVKEVAVVAMLAAVIGVIFTLLDWAYMPLSAVLGSVFMELTFCIYMLSAALPMYIVRKPGMAIFGALVTAGVNLLLGSPYGLQLILAGFLEALGVEIGYAIFGRYQGNLKNMITGQILGALFVLARDTYFWGSPWSFGPAIAAGVVIVRLLSSVILGILLVKLITAALKKTGVLKGFQCTKVERA